MSKAEKFIIEYTKNCSNEIASPYPQINSDVRKIDGEPAKEYSSWLTPDQARRAVEIAIEEMIEKVCRGYCDDMCEKGMCGMCYHKYDGEGQVKNTFKYNECYELQMLINAMKDE